MRRRVSNPDLRPTGWIVLGLVFLVQAAPGLAEWPPAELVAQSETTGRPLFWGTVVGSDGTPIAGVTLHLKSDYRFLERNQPNRDFAVDTDSAGRFAALSPAPRSHVYVFYLKVPGYLMHSEHALGIDGEPRSIVLEKAAEVRGRVVDASGTPLVGARWSLRPDTGRLPEWVSVPWWAGGETDSEGRFVADAGSGGEARLTILGPRFRGESDFFFVDPAGVELPDVVADKPILLARFQVLDTDGSPVDTAKLQTRRQTEGPFRDLGKTTPEGRLETVWRPGAATIQASHPILGRAEADFALTLDGSLPPEGPSYAGISPVVVLRLDSEPGAPTIGVEGRVVSSVGKPLADVLVRLSEGPGDGPGAGRTTEARTDAGGRWRAEVRQDGEHRLQLRARDHLLVRRDVLIEPGMEPIHDVLPRGGTLEGALRGVRPIQLATLTFDVVHRDGGNTVLNRKIVAGDPPTYRLTGIPLEGSRLRSRYSHQAPPRDHGPLNFENDGEVQRLDLDLEPGLEAQVGLTIDSRRVRNLLWHVECDGRGAATGQVSGGSGLWTVSDLDSGPCQLRIHGTLDRTDAVGFRREVWFVEDGQLIELVPETGRLRGRIVDPPEDDPQSTRGPWLYLAPIDDPDQFFDGADLDSDGSFDLQRVVEGPWLLRLLGPGLEPLAEWPIEVEGETEVELSIAEGSP